MDDGARRRVEAATVKLPGKGGQGVLVPGGYILTAAHCISWSSEGEMTLAEEFQEEIRTHAGATLWGTPHAVEPVCDIAVLAALDGYSPQEEEFEDFCNNTPAVPVCTDEYDTERNFPVHIYTHKGEWIRGSASRHGMAVAGFLVIKPESNIEGGTSGGPIVNDKGQIVALTSVFASPMVSMKSPCPHLTIPAWILRRIMGTKEK